MARAFSTSRQRPRLAPAAIVVVASVAAAASVGCGPTGSEAGDDADAPGSDAEAARDVETVDVDAEGDAELSGEPEPGPLTFVVTSYFLTEERLCDFDGDGVDDSAIADVGSPGAGLVAAYMNSELAGNVETGLRLIGHVPWVEDRRGPEGRGSVLIVTRAEDTDRPADITDDFSGEESFRAHGISLDPCGEPLYALADVTVSGGVLHAEDGTIPLHFEYTKVGVGRRARLWGEVLPDGAGADLQGCAIVPIDDVGGLEIPSILGELSVLESIVAGGAPIGLPSLPGLSPDVDLDGDGLEHFTTDAEGEILSCIDGDMTVIEGNDCWADPRIADAFALSLHFETVSAVYAGLAPNWERQVRVEGECASPPAESLWDPPAE